MCGPGQTFSENQNQKKIGFGFCARPRSALAQSKIFMKFWTAFQDFHSVRVVLDCDSAHMNSESQNDICAESAPVSDSLFLISDSAFFCLACLK